MEIVTAVSISLLPLGSAQIKFNRATNLEVVSEVGLGFGGVDLGVVAGLLQVVRHLRPEQKIARFRLFLSSFDVTDMF